MLKYPKIDFIKRTKTFMIISGVLIVLTILSALIIGVNLDIKFKGGTIVTYSYAGDVSENNVASTVSDAISQNVSIQQSTDFATGNKSFIITLTASNNVDASVIQTMTDSLTEAFPENNFEKMSDSNVSASMGKNFFLKSLVAVILAFVLMVVYIAFRFKNIGGWSAGISAIVSLLHDVIMIFGVFVVFRFSIDDNFIAAVLTILGYSINNTIIVYDRIRENKNLSGKNIAIEELVNNSINQTLSRSINTTITTMLAMIVVCVVAFLFGVNSIISFAFPMIIGMISGAYSSACISGSIWVLWQNYKNNNSKIKSNKKATAKI